MCIGSNSVNQAQDLMSVTKFKDFPNSLLPNTHLPTQNTTTSQGLLKVRRYVMLAINQEEHMSTFMAFQENHHKSGCRVRSH